MIERGIEQHEEDTQPESPAAFAKDLLQKDIQDFKKLVLPSLEDLK